MDQAGAQVHVLDLEGQQLATAEASIHRGRPQRAIVIGEGGEELAWGEVRADASLRGVSSRVVTVTHPQTGLYCVLLSGEPEGSELEGTSVTLAGTTPQALFPHTTNGQGADCSKEPEPHVSIRFYNGSGTLTDARFGFVVP